MWSFQWSLVFRLSGLHASMSSLELPLSLCKFLCILKLTLQSISILVYGQWAPLSDRWREGYLVAFELVATDLRSICLGLSLEFWPVFSEFNGEHILAFHCYKSIMSECLTHCKLLLPRRGILHCSAVVSISLVHSSYFSISKAQAIEHTRQKISTDWRENKSRTFLTNFI